MTISTIRNELELRRRHLLDELDQVWPKELVDRVEELLEIADGDLLRHLKGGAQ